MVDVHTPEQRSHNMAAIRSKNTKPEMAVRRLVHRMGYRFRLHRKDLPGNPDLAFIRQRKVMFVHGCYWHMHRCRFGRVVPRTNAEFWRIKRESNRRRDKANLREIRRLGWDALVIWECQLKDMNALEKKIRCFLDD